MEINQNKEENLIFNFNKYIKHGDFVLSSGAKTDTFYDFKLLKEEKYSNDRYFIAGLLAGLTNYYDYDNDFHYNVPIVGIKTMGSYLGKLTGCCIEYDSHEDRLERPLFTTTNEGFSAYYKYILFDDVFTTGNTMLKTIRKVGSEPIKIICIVNRTDVNKGKKYLHNIKIIEIKEIINTMIMLNKELKIRDY